MGSAAFFRLIVWMAGLEHAVRWRWLPGSNVPASTSNHHLVLRSGKHTLIAETPSPTCTVGATALRRKQMKSARAVAGICAKARVVGVAFFDLLHGQAGVAPNGIELHPVLGFRCLAAQG